MLSVIQEVSDLKEGEILAKPIYDEMGMELLAKGTKISKRMIEKIEDLGITYIYIMKNKENDISDNDKKKMSRVYKSNIETKSKIKEIYKEVVEDSSINLEKYKEIIDEIFKDILDKDAIILNLGNLKNLNEYYFEHAINSTVLAMATCLVLGLNRRLIENISIGILLHDIGYITVPNELLNKKDKLTVEEFGIVKKHVDSGYNLLKNVDDIADESLEAVRYHHENIDGTGYPEKLKGTEIPFAAKLCSICDAYDALISNRYHRKKINRYQAAMIIISNQGIKFDKYILKNFLRVVGHYPKGLSVILSNGYYAVVEKENVFDPIVRLIKDNLGNEIYEKKVIDLSQSDINIYDINYKK